MRLYIVLIAIPCVAVFVPALLTWARDLDSTARRIRQLDEQNRVVSFWDNWIKTVSAMRLTQATKQHSANSESRINSLITLAHDELADAAAAVVSIYRMSEYREFLRFKLDFAGFQVYRAGLQWYRRAFLLYKAPNTGAKLLKTMFHVLVGFTLCSFVPPRFLPPLFGHLDGILDWLSPIHSLRVFSDSYPILSRVLAFVYFVGCAVFVRQKSMNFENDPKLYIRDQLRERYSVDFAKDADSENEGQAHWQ